MGLIRITVVRIKLAECSVTPLFLPFLPIGKDCTVRCFEAHILGASLSVFANLDQIGIPSLFVTKIIYNWNLCSSSYSCHSTAKGNAIYQFPRLSKVPLDFRRCLKSRRGRHGHIQVLLHLHFHSPSSPAPPPPPRRAHRTAVVQVHPRNANTGVFCCPHDLCPFKSNRVPSSVSPFC